MNIARKTRLKGHWAKVPCLALHMMTGLPPAAAKMLVRSRFTVLFYSALWEPNATNLTFIYIDIFFFNLTICHLCFTLIEMSHCCSSPLHSVYLAILLAIAWGKKSVCVCVKDNSILPACVSSRDGDEWRGAKRQCCGSWRYCDRVWLGLAFAVVLFRLSEGQRRQLDRPTRHPPNQEGLHAGDWLRGVRGVVGYLGRSQEKLWISCGWKKSVKNMFTGCKVILY